MAVTGAASPLGEAVTAALVAAEGIGRVIAIDERRGPRRRRDLAPRRRHLARAWPTSCAGRNAVVHLAAPTDLDAAAAGHPAPRAGGAGRAGRHHRQRGGRRPPAARRHQRDGPGRHARTTRCRCPTTPRSPPQPDSGIVGDLLEVERILARTPRVHPGLAVTVLRPAALVGPDVDTVVTRHFEAPRLLKVKESENAWQFCHFDDVASAVVTALTHELDGALTVGSRGRAGPGAARAAHRDAPDRAAGRARARHRAAAAPGRGPARRRPATWPSWSTRGRSSSDRLRAAGWTAAYDNETCLGVLLEQIRGRHAVAARRMDRKDAALGAAGAAVALMGTAALMRASRRKRGSGS